MKTAFGYTNQRNYANIGLMDYRARFYSPYLNRWTQPDTIIPNLYDPQSLNRYSYVRNNPVKYTDPSGHMEVYGDYTGNATQENLVDLLNTPSSYTYPKLNMMDANEMNEDSKLENVIDSASDELNPGVEFCQGSVDTNLKHSICRYRRDPEVISYLYDYCIVQGNTCSGAGAYRYFEIGSAIPNPITGTLIGWSYARTWDFYGNKYNSLGLGIGESTITFIDLAYVVGYPGKFQKADELPEFIEGWDFDISVSPFYYIGGTFNLPFGNGGAFENGVSNPGGGFGITFTWQKTDD